MQITNEAKAIIKQALEAEQSDGIRLSTTRSSCCGGKSLNIELVKIEADEKADMINEIAVLMDEDTREWTGDVIIDGKEGKLTLINAGSCCS